MLFVPPNIQLKRSEVKFLPGETIDEIVADDVLVTVVLLSVSMGTTVSVSSRFTSLSDRRPLLVLR